MGRREEAVRAAPMAAETARGRRAAVVREVAAGSALAALEAAAAVGMALAAAWMAAEAVVEGRRALAATAARTARR